MLFTRRDPSPPSSSGSDTLPPGVLPPRSYPGFDPPPYQAPPFEPPRFEPGPPPKLRRTWRWWTPRILGGLFALFVVLVAWLAITAPLSKSLQPIAPPQVTLLAADGTPIARSGAVIASHATSTTNSATSPPRIRGVHQRQVRLSFGGGPGSKRGGSNGGDWNGGGSNPG